MMPGNDQRIRRRNKHKHDRRRKKNSTEAFARRPGVHGGLRCFARKKSFRIFLQEILYENETCTPVLHKFSLHLCACLLEARIFCYALCAFCVFLLVCVCVCVSWRPPIILYQIDFFFLAECVELRCFWRIFSFLHDFDVPGNARLPNASATFRRVERSMEC